MKISRFKNLSGIVELVKRIAAILIQINHGCAALLSHFVNTWVGKVVDGFGVHQVNAFVTDAHVVDFDPELLLHHPMQ